MGNGSSKKVETSHKEEKAFEPKLSRPILTGQIGQINPQSELDFESFVENSSLDEINKRLREAALQRAPKTPEPEKGLFGFDEDAIIAPNYSDKKSTIVSGAPVTPPPQPGQIYLAPDSQRSYNFIPIIDSSDHTTSTSTSSEEESFSQEILSLSSEASEDIAYISSAPDFSSLRISISDKKSATAPAKLEQTYFPSTSQKSFDSLPFQQAVRPGTLTPRPRQEEIVSLSIEPAPLQKSKRVFNFPDLQGETSEQSRTYEGSGNSGSFVDSNKGSFVEFSTLISSTSYVSENLSVDDRKAPSYDSEDQKIAKIILGLPAKAAAFDKEQETLNISSEKPATPSLTSSDIEKSFVVIPQESALAAKYTAQKTIDTKWEQVKKYAEEQKLRASSDSVTKTVKIANPAKTSLQIPEAQDATTQPQEGFVPKRRQRTNNMLKRERFDYKTAEHIVGTPLEDIYNDRPKSKPIDLPSKPKVELPNKVQSSVQNSIQNNSFRPQPDNIFSCDEDLAPTANPNLPTQNNNPIPVEQSLSESYLTFEKKLTSRYKKEPKQKSTLQRSNFLEEILSNPPTKSPVTVSAIESPKVSLLTLSIKKEINSGEEQGMSKSPSERE